MDIIKQYLVQCIITAANSLRLSSEKIEVVALLKESIAKAENTSEHIRSMKKITELSKFAIKLGEIYTHMSSTKIDFLKLSDDFKEHSHSLIRDLSVVLDILTPQIFRAILTKLENKDVQVVLGESNISSERLDKMITDIKQESVNQSELKDKSFSKREEQIVNSNPAHEENVEDEEFLFDDFERKIVEPIKQIEPLLKKLAINNFDIYELQKYIDIFEENLILSEKTGFEIISRMHEIFLRALNLISDGKIIPTKELIERMRSCLIVIVAVVRSKDVDINSYLKKAETFSIELKKIS
ncbi:MAG: hypothetical protein V1720_18030 [bacterium]